jgi:hypothetical protein
VSLLSKAAHRRHTELVEERNLDEFLKYSTDPDVKGQLLGHSGAGRSLFWQKVRFGPEGLV